MYEASTAQSRFRRVATIPTALQDLLDEVKPDRVVVEVGLVTGWVSDLVQAAQIPLQVANTAAPAWRWSNTKRKTDRDDALRLAQMSAMNQLPQVHIPQRDVRQWRAVIRYRHHLVARRTQVKNRIRALLVRQGLSLAPGKTSWATEPLAALRILARPIEDVGIDDL